MKYTGSYRLSSYHSYSNYGSVTASPDTSVALLRPSKQLPTNQLELVYYIYSSDKLVIYH